MRTFQFVEHNRWFDALGVGYIVGVDGFSIFMVAITALLFPIGLLAAAKQDIRVKAYTFWFLLLEGVIMGIFLSLDLICFFVFWEAMLVPMYFLISGWGSKRREYASIKFVIYTMFGSAFLLASILVLGFLHQNATGHLTFDYRVLADWNGLASSTEKLLFLGFMIAFAIKAPLFPFHTWLADVHTEAPTAGSVVLAGVILKMGAYGFLRFSFELFPKASVYFAPLIMTLAVIGIIYGSIVAAMQTDIKRVIAFSSVAHMGFILLGIFSLTIFGLDGASVQHAQPPAHHRQPLPRRRDALRTPAHPRDLASSAGSGSPRRCSPGSSSSRRSPASGCPGSPASSASSSPSSVRSWPTGGGRSSPRPA